MKSFRILGFATIVLVACTGRLALAQHLHAHGDHFDVHENVRHGHDSHGHMVDRFGHHIDGHGNHTGRMGVYDNGTFNYSHSNHNYGNYGNYYGSTWNPLHYSYPSILSSPSVFYSAPSLYSLPRVLSPSISIPNSSITRLSKPILSDSTIVANKIPIPGTVGANSIPGSSGRGGSIKLINPRNNAGSVTYLLNNYTYTINPGEAQTLNLDRDWIIKFDNGLGKPVSYRLAEGKYEFSVSPSTGWDVVKRAELEPSLPSVPTPIAEPPAVPNNSQPVQSAPATEALPTVAIPTET